MSDLEVGRVGTRVPTYPSTEVRARLVATYMHWGAAAEVVLSTL